MYTPSFGWFLALAVLFDWASRSKLLVERRVLASSLRIAFVSSIVLAGAWTAVRTTDWADSQSLWQSALDNGFETYRAHSNLGHELLRSNDYSEAARHYERAVELSPRTIWVRYSLAATLQVLGRSDEALRQCEYVFREAPGDMKCHYVAGQALIELGDDGAALQHFAAFLRESPSNPMALVQVAEILARRAETDPGSAEKAVTFGLAAREATVSSERGLHLEASRVLIKSLVLSGRWDDARGECRSLLESVPHDTTCARILSPSGPQTKGTLDPPSNAARSGSRVVHHRYHDTKTKVSPALK
jgi:tetratricopeptide (TPR) repeat protein